MMLIMVMTAIMMLTMTMIMIMTPIMVMMIMMMQTMVGMVVKMTIHNDGTYGADGGGEYGDAGQGQLVAQRKKTAAADDAGADD
eukprot:463866-Alexandrium_andersonii.AAC.1